MPTQMKCVPEEAINDLKLSEEITVDPIARGFISDWDAMEDLLHHLVYNSLGWEIGNEGHILFADPLLTPKVIGSFISFNLWSVIFYYLNMNSFLLCYVSFLFSQIYDISNCFNSNAILC